MAEKRLGIWEFVQRLSSLWLVMLAVFYLGNRHVFYRVLGLSTVALFLLLGLFIILRRRRGAFLSRLPARISWPG